MRGSAPCWRPTGGSLNGYINGTTSDSIGGTTRCAAISSGGSSNTIRARRRDIVGGDGAVGERDDVVAVAEDVVEASGALVGSEISRDGRKRSGGCCLSPA